MNKKCFINKQYKINETKKHITRDVRWRLNFNVMRKTNKNEGMCVVKL